MSRGAPRFPLPLASVTSRSKHPARAAVPAPASPTSATCAPAPSPQGLGLDSAAVRARMIARLRDEGIADERVLAAIGRVERHRFVDAALAAQAYENTALPIGHGQTISQPWVVARAIELLLLDRTVPARDPARPLGRVLEVGAGCGYQAAVLAELAQQVVSIERLRPLFDKAQSNLAAAGVRRVRLVYGDGRLGHGPLAPYDSVVCAAGGEDIPPAWLEQMAEGARLVAPMEHEGRGQVLLAVARAGDRWTRRAFEAVRFVPLRSGTA